jgi:AcrR family transcriptional regulator
MATLTMSDARARTGPAEAATPAARVLDGTVRCVARWGLAKTTLDDIAREAGVSRATVYRSFPGGKDNVVRAAAAAEVRAFLDGLEERLRSATRASAGGTVLEDLLVAGITYAVRAIREHGALQFLVEHEPEVVLPHVTFGAFDRLLAAAGDWVRPWLAPHLGEEQALRAGEWVTRMVLSYTLSPSESFDLAEQAAARRFTKSFLLPGLHPEIPAKTPDNPAQER